MVDNVRLLWIDLETTGSELEGNEIIEIASVLTDHELNELDRHSIVVRPSPEAFGRMMLDPVVHKMHTDNGLIDDCTASRVTCKQADAYVVQWLNTFVRGHQRVLLSGSGVQHFDRKFIERDLPQLHKRLRWNFVDVGVVRRFLSLWGLEHLIPQKGSDKSHRALDDILLHLEEARHYKELFSELGKPKPLLPTEEEVAIYGEAPNTEGNEN